MNSFSSIYCFKSTKKNIITLGTFDGVHLGHQSILNKLRNSTEKGEYESLVLTFFPHPRMVLQQDSSILLLNTIEEKKELLEIYGVNNLIIHPFDEIFSNLSAEEFVKTILVEKLNIHKIIIGHDHRFGKNRTANIDDLIVFGEKYNFEVEQINAEEINEISVSSTKIRTALLNGEVKLANSYLGYNYFFSGKVVHGKQLGRTIGFPTANISIEENYKLIPKNGVYIVSSILEGDVVYGMMNIGHNPTIGANEKTIEVHYFNIKKELYNKRIKITFLQHIRDEQKFESINALVEQLNKDREFSLAFLKKHENISF